MTGDDVPPRPPDEYAERQGLASSRAPGREPPPELRERIMREAAEPSFVFLRSGEGIWLPSPNASVATRLLYREQTDRVSTRLVQLATGHTLPAPLLEGVRAIYVVSGTVHGQGSTLEQGDFAEEARPVQEWRARRPSTVLELSMSRRETYGLRVLAVSLAIWTPAGPGLRARTLVNAPDAGRELSLIRADAGAALEGHAHEGVEELYVLEGSCLIENQQMVAGDYHRAAAGSQHGPATTAEGCLLFSASRDLRLLPAA